MCIVVAGTRRHRGVNFIPLSTHIKLKVNFNLISRIHDLFKNSPLLETFKKNNFTVSNHTTSKSLPQ